MSLPSLNGAKPRKSFKREKLAPGTYEAVVLDCRWHAGFKGKGFFVDFRVPEADDFEGAYMVYPDNAKAQGRMTREMAYAAELGKIQVALAALYGFPDTEAERIDDAIFEASIARPVSPLRGARFVIKSVAHTNKSGEQTVYYEVQPHPQGNGLTPGAAPAASAPSAPSAPSKPKAPPAKPAAKKPTFEEAYTAAGYQVHPEDSNYLFSDTEVKLVSVVQAELGYLQG